VTAGNWFFQWGLPGDVPIAGDFDGDGKSDISVYRPSTGEWFLRLSTQNYGIMVGNWYYQWGVPGDQPVGGDFDGDGKTDIAIYRPSTGEWYLRLSTQNYAIAAGNWLFTWGVPGDQPVAGDFDGDKKTDIAIYRPSTGEWYIRLSTQNYAIAAGTGSSSGVCRAIFHSKRISMATGKRTLQSTDRPQASGISGSPVRDMRLGPATGSSSGVWREIFHCAGKPTFALHPVAGSKLLLLRVAFEGELHETIQQRG
jgi:uncharacterized protein YegP (UPF0339 family)